jgi:ubiquinone biosynthesis UbiH/UbiF/VisC/COQ6 family hydroxylase
MVIVGGGPAGLSLACLAASAGRTIAIVDEQPQDVLASPLPDGRDIALTHRSVRLLKEIGVWDALLPADISPIRKASVGNAAKLHILGFDPAAAGRTALGYLVANHTLRAALFAALRQRTGVDLICGELASRLDLGETSAGVHLSSGRKLSAPLLVAADGRFSRLRRMAGISAGIRDFGRVCIVCRMRHELAHDSTAIEWFGEDRTLAVLPLNNNLSSIVLTLPADAADKAMAVAPEEFAEDVARRFSHTWGTMHVSGNRHAYPLVAVYADTFIARRLALLGDAAVGMHPVTAHGYNFGLAGAASLAAKVNAARGEFAAAVPAILKAYDREHRWATLPLYLATNALVRHYTDNSRPAALARDAVLRIGERLAPAKHFLLRRLMEDDASGAASGLRVPSI